MTEAEFHQLLVSQRDRLHTYAAWSLGDLEAAKDACQEAYMRLWQHRSRVHPLAGRAWLYRVIHRLCVDQHRRSAGTSQLAAEGLLEAAADASGAGCPEDIRQVVADGLAQLSAPDRALLVLKELIGMPIAEISSITEQPPGNIKVALHRARQRLRHQLLRVYGQDGP